MILTILSALGKKGRKGLWNGLTNLWNRYTGSGLTGSQREANAWSAEEADKQRAWEEEMSNTAYQRQVRDMQAAGLNPALMYGGAGSSGASTPSVSQPSSVSPQEGNISDLFSSIMDMALLGAQIKNINADTENKKEEARGRGIENEFKPAILQQGLEKGEVEIQNLQSGIALASANIQRVMSDIEVNKSVIGLNEAEVKEVLARASKEEIEAANESLRAKGIEADNLAKAEQVVLMRTQEAVNIANAALANANVSKVGAETNLISLNAFDTQYDIAWKQKYGTKPGDNPGSKAISLIQKVATHSVNWKEVAKNFGFFGGANKFD